VQSLSKSPLSSLNSSSCFISLPFASPFHRSAHPLYDRKPTNPAQSLFLWLISRQRFLIKPWYSVTRSALRLHSDTPEHLRPVLPSDSVT
jgi:hypothetical protein